MRIIDVPDGTYIVKMKDGLVNNPEEWYYFDMDAKAPMSKWTKEEYDSPIGIGNNHRIVIKKYKCNNCGHYSDLEYHFCPNCGNKME